MGPLLRIAFISFSLATAGCADSNSSSGAGESQYLKACDALCGTGLSCVCGVCTTTCDGSDDCRGRHAASSCVANGAASCGATGEPSVCDFDCTSDGQCESLGDGFECIGGFCRGPHVNTGDSPSAGDGDGVSGSGGQRGDGDGDGVGGSDGDTGPGGSCEYGGQTYGPGDSFPSTDGCNQCSCSDGGAVACTRRACAA